MSCAKSKSSSPAGIQTSSRPSSSSFSGSGSTPMRIFSAAEASTSRLTSSRHLSQGTVRLPPSSRSTSTEEAFFCTLALACSPAERICSFSNSSKNSFPTFHSNSVTPDLKSLSAITNLSSITTRLDSRGSKDTNNFGNINPRRRFFSFFQ